MSGQSQSRVPWLSRFKKRAASALTPLSSASRSRQHSHSPGNSTRGLDISAHHAGVDVSSMSVSRPPVPASTLPTHQSPDSSLPPQASLHLHPPSSDEVEVPNHYAVTESSSTSVSYRPSVANCSVQTPNLIFPHSPLNLAPLPMDSVLQQDPPSLQDNTGRLNIAGPTSDLPPISTPRCPSSSNVAVPCIANFDAPPNLCPSPPTPPQQSLLSGHNVGRPGAPGYPADAALPVGGTSRPPSASSTQPPTTNHACAGPYLNPRHHTHRIEDSTTEKYSSTDFSYYAPPQLFQEQGQGLSYQGPSQMFNQAQNFVVKDTMFIENNITVDNFMKELLQETIIGAEFDSSARDPPPRCHPGTRLAIIQRCLDFINQCIDEGKLRWVVGPAGVGKSAVMQMVTEMAPDNIISASIFFSINGRSDGKKTVLTLAYQLAVKCGPYRQFIRDQIGLDPSLLRKSLSVQFKKFIVEPFVLKRIVEPSRRFLVVIDGLDECDDPLTQQALLELITGFCIAHPTSPIAWIVASRPEPHITSFFDIHEVQLAYKKEEMVIDSDEACEDVQRYLCEELKKIKLAHPALRYKREWPLEHEFTTIASAAGGLFAYAATVVRYIRDSTRGGPAAQLRRVLETIGASAKDHVVGRDHPMDQLDALYRRILSNVPENVMPNTRKLLFIRPGTHFHDTGFRGMCNALKLTEDDAYDAISPLHAVMKFPGADNADDRLSYYHKSFEDFLSDFERSGFSRQFEVESSHCYGHAASKISEELQGDSDGASDSRDIEVWGGLLKGHCDNISLSWPGDGRFEITDEEMRIKLYTAAVCRVRIDFSIRGTHFRSVSGFHALTTHVTKPMSNYPFDMLRVCAFDEFRDELARLGKLKRVPLRTLDLSAVFGDVELRFTISTGCDVKFSGYWNSSCTHGKQDLDGSEQWQGWSTMFKRYYHFNPETEDDEDDKDDKEDEDSTLPQSYVAPFQQSHQTWVQEHISYFGRTTGCIDCSERLARLFTSNPDLLATVFVDSTQMTYVEVAFTDPDDGVSEWRYRFLHSGRPSCINV